MALGNRTCGLQPHRWAPGLYLSSAPGLQSFPAKAMLEECWSTATAIEYFALDLNLQTDFLPCCRGSPWLSLDLILNPDLWIDFPTSPWTCLIIVILPYGLDSWLDLAAISRSVLLGTVGWWALAARSLPACLPSGSSPVLSAPWHLQTSPRLP